MAKYNGERITGNRTPSYQRIADERVSTTDPDVSPMRPSGGGNAVLGYRDHYIVDGGKERIILLALVTPASIMDNTPMLDLVKYVCSRWKIHPKQATGDTKYGTIPNIVGLEEMGIKAYLPTPDLYPYFYGSKMFLTKPNASQELSDILLKFVSIDNAIIQVSMLIQNPLLSSSEVLPVVDDWIFAEYSQGNISAAKSLKADRDLIQASLVEFVSNGHLDNDPRSPFVLIKIVQKMPPEQQEIFLSLARSSSTDQDFEAELLEMIHEINRLSAMSEMKRLDLLCRFLLTIMGPVMPRELWAKIKGNLGVALLNMPVGNRAEQLEEAIDCFQEALSVLSKEKYPQLWVQTQTNLANT